VLIIHRLKAMKEQSRYKHWLVEHVAQLAGHIAHQNQQRERDCCAALNNLMLD